MSRRFLLILAVFMAFAMIGLIVVQAYWIKNAYQLKEKQFGQAVNRALNNVAVELQERETMWNFLNEVEASDTSWPGPQEIFSFQFEGSQSGGEINMDFNARFHQDRIPDENYYIYEKTDPQSGNTEVTIVAQDTVLTNDDYSLLNVYASRGVHIRWIQPDQIMSRLKRDMVENQIFFNRVMRRMIAPNTPIEHRINREILNRIIDRQLAGSGIDLNYEYAVLRDNLEVAFHTDNYNAEEESDYFMASLFPGDFFSNSGYLSLYFPRKASFLLRSLGFMGISSMILTLIIIMSFSITIYIIFRQKRLSEIKNDFVSNMTHELKTPISTISLASQMLNDNSIPGKMKNLDKISGIITDESKRLGYQVEKVLQMAIFDRGRLKLKKKKTDLHDLIHNVVVNFTLQVEKQNGMVKESYNAENTVLEVDPVHFTNLVSNLLDNAVKYSGDDPQVGVATYNRNDMFIMRIRDNGIGIKKEDQKRIFEKFYRVPTGNVHNVKGFGLGLSYVKMIVDEHNGSISLKSELTKGTEFEISLPLNSH